MSVVICLVGNQPCAVAVVIRTLMKQLQGNDPLGRVFLLPTLKTFPFARMLQGELGRWKLAVEIETVSHSYVATPVPKTPHQALERPQEVAVRLLKMEKLKDEQVFFDTSPGMNFHVCALAAVLKGLGVVPVFADDATLSVLGRAISWPLEDLGLETVLRLHGLRIEGTEEQGRWHDASLMKKAHGKIHFDCLFEKRGRLYGLVKIKTGRSRLEKEKARYAARRVKALQRDPRKLNSLRPRIVVLTNDGNVQGRLRAYGIDTILNTDPGWDGNATDILQRWEQENMLPPGSSTPGERDSFPPEPCVNIEGAGGSNDPLVVCLGNDPSATLLAVFSHRPRELLVCYDRHTPFVSALAGRLLEWAKELPIGRISFVSTDHLGAGMVESISRWIEGSNERRWLANASPGTKAQAWMLAVTPGVDLCTLKRSSATVESLDGRSLFPFASPSILIQASICGGPVISHGMQTIDAFHRMAKPTEDFLKTMVEAVAHYARKQKFGGVSLVGMARAGGPFKLTFTADKGRRLTVAVRKDRILYKGQLSGDASSGLWLEPVVAYALYRAGKGRVTDLLFPVSWYALDEEVTPGRPRRTELDIALRWHSDYLAVSCKANFPDEAHYWAAREEIIGVARTNLGRFCLPVLAGPVPYRGRSLPDVKERLLELPLRKLDQPDEIHRLVEEQRGLQRTTGP